jgi:hypothetical protein
MKGFLYLLIIAAMILQHCDRADQLSSDGGGDVVTTGKVYLPNGSNASNCTMTAVPSNAIPGSDMNIPITTTDASGQFVFKDLLIETYNLFAKKGDYASYRKNVQLGNVERQVLPNDTLKPVGSLTGIVKLSASADSRSVLILVIGGTTASWPNDSSGGFSIPGLAEGTYRIRFLALDYKYDILDTSFNVISGQATDVGTIQLKLK